jgi:dihydroflavonol-4-reductase
MTAVTAVTGASGHVGANLVRALLEAGRPVRAIVHDDTAGIDGLPVERIEGDVRDVASLKLAFAEVDVVFHLASKITIGTDDPVLVRAINIGGARNVVEACLDAKVRRLVHFSSIHALSSEPADQVIDETRPPATGSVLPLYDVTKSEGEREVSAGVARGLDAVILNPTAVLGPHDYAPSRMGAVLLDLYHRRLPALVQGGFNWVDVRDVVRGAMAAEQKGRRGERYLLSGEWRTVAELAMVVEQTTQVKAPPFVVPMWVARLGVPFASATRRFTGKRPLFTSDSLSALRRHRWISHEKATRELGYQPRPLTETIADTFAWFRQAGRLGAAS